MLDYASARAVALVVQTGSFEAAARALNVTPSAISQRVRNLEERIGAVLVTRGSPCGATEKGAWLCRHMEQVGMLEQTLFAHLPGLARDGGTGAVTIPLAANADSLGTWLLPAIAESAIGAGHLLDIAVDDEEHTADWLRSGRVVAAVTAHGQPVAGCSARPLGALRYVATASPAFMQRHLAAGVNPGTLGRAPALTYNRKDRLQQAWARATFGTDVVLATHWLPSTRGFVEASLLGLGWAMNPRALVAGHLAAGRLVEVIPDRPFDRPLYWQVSRIAGAGLAGLTRAVLAAARQALVAPARPGDAGVDGPAGAGGNAGAGGA